MRSNLSKNDLYESVKTLVETEEDHIHLCQQKLFTLFSISFQYLLFRATKVPGAYIIRIEDSHLAEKLLRKSKDPSTRKFLQTLLVPRKLKYGKSTFFLDFFHIGTWSLVNDIPKDKIQGALVVKNSTSKPMDEVDPDEEIDQAIAALPENYYYTSLQDFSPKSIIIAYNEEFDGTKKVEFPFIQKEKEKLAQGVTISKEVDLDNLN